MSDVAVRPPGRVTPAPPEQYEPIFGPGTQMQQRILAQSPPIAEAVLEYMKAVYFGTQLEARLVELVRLRVSFHSQCRTCMATRNPETGVDERLVCALENPAEAEDLTKAERAALAYADLLASNHRSITDETYDELRRHFDERSIVELGVLIAASSGLGKLLSSWNITHGVPAEFLDRQGETLTPWGATEVIVNTERISGGYVIQPAT